LGIGYIRREGNEQAKAGNLNHALEVTEGEFILQLDADHVPMADILHRLLGFFEDPKVAFVQSPQDFYNDDSFTHDVDEQGRRIWEEQRIFFTIIQPGKDRWNAAFFCGSCGIIRRSAFEEIGGILDRDDHRGHGDLADPARTGDGSPSTTRRAWPTDSPRDRPQPSTCSVSAGDRDPSRSSAS
jgi:cellulose synthase/poly-beta-1,6-N-acetylglucosamine synthase-like glycosyltransferase